MAILVTPPLHLHVRGEVDGIADLKGCSIRVTGAGATSLLESLGMVPVALPVATAYENLQKCVIDGTLAEFTAVDAFRIDEVTDTHILIEVGSALLFPGMNKDRLASLSPDLQDLVRTRFSGPEIAVRAAEYWQSLGEAVSGELQADRHTIVEVTLW